MAKHLTIKEKVRRLVYGLKKRGASDRDQGLARKWLLGWFNGERVCCYCNKSLAVEDCSLDHKTPVSREGSNRRENLVVCCKRCNFAKGDMNSNEFLALMAVLRSQSFADGGERVLRRLVAAGRMFNRWMRHR